MSWFPPINLYTYYLLFNYRKEDDEFDYDKVY